MPSPTPSLKRALTAPLSLPPEAPKRNWRVYALGALLALMLLGSFWGVQANLGDLLKGSPQMLDTLSRMLPPDTSDVTNPKVYAKPDNLTVVQLFAPLPLSKEQAFDKAAWWNNSLPQTVVGATVQTVEMALAGTFLALLIAFPLSFLAARNTTPNMAIYHTVKTSTNFLRTIPDIAVGLIFIAAIGLGPFPGTLTLALTTSTVFVKLFAECIEGIDPGVVEAVSATGARSFQVLSFAVVPQVMPAFISFVLYRFESNIRAATVLGLIGAGGIGQIMDTDFRMFEYAKASMSVVVLIVLVMAVDYLSARLRRLVT